VPIAAPTNKNDPHVEMTTMSLYLWYLFKKKPAVNDEMIPVTMTQAPSPEIYKFVNPTGAKS
jgi:hypothetical protein